MSISLNLLPLHSWLPEARVPFIISGPCGAESFEQLLETAVQIAALGKVNVLRAGIWKPRTRPDSFEGRGEEALVWLSEAKKVTGLKTAVEVANVNHVQKALLHKVDILWIGARTTVNPFYVQEIADALKGIDIPVMVKNPVNPDLPLWIGALERLNKTGLTKLVAIHRGFTSYSKTPYRNTPNWKIAIELKRLIPELPVLCDISHISGNRELLLPVAQKALDLEMNGLMIESHRNPSEALSDAKQQVTPFELNELLNSLVVRRKKSDNTEFENKLQILRNKIDKIDHQLIEVLAQRMKVVDKIGEYKREHEVTILQLERWAQILNDRIPYGKELDLDSDFVTKLYNLIHDESIRIQTNIMNAPVEVKS